ncbi:ferrochelatase [Siphonobacter sp. BAB-5385]|uniref:ferrochelatase n=1 Tax=unclassified Siphonobacter TaxID=2635712 RepID=UPI000B9E92CD|nr:MULTISPECIES: ferrochelatase [unclassified Siphonobacter]OZI09846.1 ferrochelatase [Siphonobacter sp. BAB-5385]PMD98249.1 ferrochelatase [Siphonobacter sp. BAB-5405]
MQVLEVTSVPTTQKLKTGILLVNLGTPDSPSVPDVRKYLREFLMDGRVIDIPTANRWALVNLIIAPFRAPKSAKVYQELWEERGSPLKFYGEDVKALLQQRLGSDYVVELAMRYQNPSIQAGLDSFQKAGLRKIIVIPFFPQYASATTGSVYEKVMDIVGKWQVIPEISFTNTFFDHPKFVEFFAGAARKYMQEREYDFFLFSYHGVPERQILKGDATGTTCQLNNCCDRLHSGNQYCYRAQCFATTRLLVQELGLKEGTYATSFQSRLGKTPWIQPYTEDMVVKLAKEGKKNVLAFSPAFVADCLETTIEVGEEYKEVFEKNGGQHWQLVESLNNSPQYIDLLADLVEKQV